MIPSWLWDVIAHVKEQYGFIFIGTAIEPPKERKRVGAEEIVSNWS